MNLAENLDRTARARGRFDAVRLEDTATSFGEVDLWSRRVAGFLLGHGVRAGDRVGLVLPDVLEFAALYYGVLRLGAVVVPMSPLLAEPDVRHRLRDSGASGVVVGAAHRSSVEPAARSLGIVVWVLGAGGLADLLGDAPALDPIVPRRAEDPAVIAFTAGTTGLPLGAELTHGNLVRNCEVVINDLLQLTSDDVVLAGLPLFHLLTQTTALNAAVRSGACLVLLTDVDGAVVLRTLHERGVTVLEGSPQVYEAVLRHPHRADHDLPRLRVGMSGGAAMPTDVLLEFEDAFGCVVLEGYGLAETSPVVSSNRMDRRRVGSVGTPVKGVELRLVDDAGDVVADGEPGEIVVRGHNVMNGYTGREAATAATIVGGWLHTGDVGLEDEDGFLYVLDRLSDLVVRDGHTVFPRAIEEVLLDHPAVSAAAVIGVPHPSLGAEVRALVTLQPGATVTAAELGAFVRERVAPHQSPREIDVVEQIPTSPTGTILKRAIRLETRA